MSSHRPDISFAVHVLARSMSAPSRGDCERLKRLARYLKGKPRIIKGFTWQGLTDTLSIYSDAGWASDKRGRKSTSGGRITIGNRLLLFSAVCLSTLFRQGVCQLCFGGVLVKFGQCVCHFVWAMCLSFCLGIVLVILFGQCACQVWAARFRWRSGPGAGRGQTQVQVDVRPRCRWSSGPGTGVARALGAGGVQAHVQVVLRPRCRRCSGPGASVAQARVQVVTTP